MFGIPPVVPGGPPWLRGWLGERVTRGELLLLALTLLLGLLAVAVGGCRPGGIIVMSQVIQPDCPCAEPTPTL